MFFEKHMTVVTNETVFSGEACPTTQPSLEQEVAQVVGACMLARQIDSTYALGPTESAFMQQLLLDDDSTKEALLTAVKIHGNATNDRAVERSAAALRPDGLIETVQLWRAARYRPSEKIIELARQSITERQEAIASAREMLRNGLGDDLHRSIDDSRSVGAQNHPHHYALDRLFENLGWPIPSGVLTRPDDKANNIQRVLKEMEGAFPEGMLVRVGEKNKTRYMLALEWLAELTPNASIVPEVVTIDIEHLSALKLALYIRSERALMLLDLLEQYGGTLSRKRINELFSLADNAVTKEKMYIAIRELRKHGLILTHEDDETIPRHSLRLNSEFDLGDYAEDGAIRLQSRDKRRIARKVLSEEERLAHRRRQYQLKQLAKQKDPEWLKNKERLAEAKRARERERAERIARFAEKRLAAKEARELLERQQAEESQRKRKAIEEQKRQEELRADRESRSFIVDTSDGLYPHVLYRPTDSNTLFIEVNCTSPSLVEAIVRYAKLCAVPLEDETIAEFATDFGVSLKDAKAALLAARTSTDAPLFRSSEIGISLTPLVMRGNRSFSFKT